MARWRLLRRCGWFAAAGTVSLGAIAGCGEATEERDRPDSADVDEIVITERLETDPFCTEMLAIADEELDGPQTAERYRELTPLVPAVLTSDFEALIVTLSSPPVDPVLDGVDEIPIDIEIDPDIDDSMTPEVPLEPLSPGEVVSAWVDANCRATTINPLPQPSAPD